MDAPPSFSFCSAFKRAASALALSAARGLSSGALGMPTGGVLDRLGAAGTPSKAFTDAAASALASPSFPSPSRGSSASFALAAAISILICSLSDSLSSTAYDHFKALICALRWRLADSVEFDAFGSLGIGATSGGATSEFDTKSTSSPPSGGSIGATSGPMPGRLSFSSIG